MNRLVFVALFLAASCKTTQAPDRPAFAGANGIDGRNGKDGKDGKSCGAASVEGKVAIQCEGQNRVFTLPQGEKGEAGRDGLSCEIVSVHENVSFVMLCPDAREGFRTVKVENGKMGETGKPCEYVTPLAGGQQLRCGDQYFVLQNGAKGDRGEAGQDGFSTTISSLIQGVAEENQNTIQCRGSFKTTDASFGKRAVNIFLIQGEKILSTQSGNAERFITAEAGFLGYEFRVMPSADAKDYKCRFEVFAESFSASERAMALTAAGDSMPLSLKYEKRIALKDLELDDPKVRFSKLTTSGWAAIVYFNNKSKKSLEGCDIYYGGNALRRLSISDESQLSVYLRLEEKPENAQLKVEARCYENSILQDSRAYDLEFNENSFPS